MSVNAGPAASRHHCTRLTDTCTTRFRYFFVECIDYSRSQMASRILVVANSSAGNEQVVRLRGAGVQLREYDPLTDMGPWRVVDGVNYTLQTAYIFDPKVLRAHTTEFVVLDDVPLVGGALLKIRTNDHGGDWCKKKGNRCVEKNIAFSTIVSDLMEKGLKEYVNMVVLERLRSDPEGPSQVLQMLHSGKFDGLCPGALPVLFACVTLAQVLVEVQAETVNHWSGCALKHRSFPDADFNGWEDNELCKAVCQSVNESFDSGDRAAKNLCDAFGKPEVPISESQWKAMLASLVGAGPVQSKGQLKTSHIRRFLGCFSEIIVTLPEDFLKWLLLHSDDAGDVLKHVLV